MNFKQFVEAFFKILEEESSHADGGRVIFDSYIDHTLKGSTREKRKTYNI